MKYIIIICALFSLSLAAVLPQDVQAVILDSENTNDGSGNYRFSFSTSNGIYRQEIGNFVKIGSEEHFVVKGSYSYTDPEGNVVSRQYTADENGYREEPLVVMPPSFAVPANVVASLLG